MTETSLRMSFESDLSLIKQPIARILDCIKSQFPYITEEELFDLKVIYKELLVNAVIHGNLSDRSKKVYLMVIIETNSVLSIIRDEGKGFNYHKELLLKHPVTEEHGRGLSIVRALTDFLSFNEDGNMIIFQKYLFTPAPKTCNLKIFSGTAHYEVL